MGEKHYITAFDPVAKRRLVYVVFGRTAISLVTFHKFNLSNKDLATLKKAWTKKTP